MELDEAGEGRAVAVFLAMDTQWRIGGLGIATGLDYTMIDSVARNIDVPWDGTAFLQLRELEHEALRLMAEQRKTARR